MDSDASAGSVANQERRPNTRRFPAAAISGGFIAAIALLAGFIYMRQQQDVKPAMSLQSAPAVRAANENISRAAKGTRNIAAYDLYLRGIEPVLLRSDSTAALGLQYFNRAIELDSSFAAAHAALAQMYVRMAFSDNPPFPQTELRRRAEAEARKAVALDDSLAEAHQSLGFVGIFWPTDIRAAEAELNRALKLDPHLPHTLEYLALSHVMLAEPQKALIYAEQAVADDPLSPINRASMAQMLYVNGRCKEALPILDSLDAVKPPLLRVANIRLLCYAEGGQWSDADAFVHTMRRAKRISGMIGFTLAREGRKTEAREVRTQLLTIASRNPAAFFEAAEVSYGLGDIDDAIADLDRTVDAGPFPYELLGPVFAPLRRDTRFKTIANRRGIQLASNGF